MQNICLAKWLGGENAWNGRTNKTVNFAFELMKAHNRQTDLRPKLWAQILMKI
jgi:hypothetical protein